MPRRAPRVPEPPVDEDITGAEASGAVRRELRTLSKDNAQGVARHMVMIERLLDSDPERARAHADHIVARAGRVASVREARGLVAYHDGDWKVALNEFRTARRLSGSNHLLPYLVDIERALGRPERALDLAATPEALTLDKASRIELDIVVSGIRRDMGDLDAALLRLTGPELDPAKRRPWSGRLFYAYADVLAAMGRMSEARRWFAEAVDADPALGTDAAERLDEIDGTVFVDLGEDDNDTPEEHAGDDGQASGERIEPVGKVPGSPGETGTLGERGETGLPDEGPGAPDELGESLAGAGIFSAAAGSAADGNGEAVGEQTPGGQGEAPGEVEHPGAAAGPLGETGTPDASPGDRVATPGEGAPADAPGGPDGANPPEGGVSGEPPAPPPGTQARDDAPESEER